MEKKKNKEKRRLSLLQLAAQQNVLVVHKLLNNKCLVMWRRTATSIGPTLETILVVINIIFEVGTHKL